MEIRKQLAGENDRDDAAKLDNLASIYRDQGDFARAEPLYKQALEIQKRVLGENHPDFAASLVLLSGLYEDQGNYARAEPLIEQALEIDEKAPGENYQNYTNGLDNLAYLCEALGEYSRAEPLFRKALEIREKVGGKNSAGCAVSLNNLGGLCYRQGDYAQAERLLRQVLEIDKQMPSEIRSGFANDLMSNLADLYCCQGDYARAEPLYRQAAANIRGQLEATAAVQSERQQLAMLKHMRWHLDAYLTLLAKSGRYADAAYREMLAWKGSVLRRQRQVRTAGENPELAPIVEQLQRVATQLAEQARAMPDPQHEAGGRERVAKLSAEKERLEAELSSRSTAYRQAKHQVSLEELQAALPQDVALVDFLEYSHDTPADKKAGTKRSWEKRLLAFVVTHGRPVEMVPLGAVQPIAAAIDTWLATFGMSPRGAAAGRLLRGRIWEPLEGKLHGAKVVLVSPDGVLGRLPLGALPAKEPGKYLIEVQAIALIAVPQLVPEILKDQGPRRLSKNMLLVGNVDYDAEPGRTVPAARLQPPHRLAAHGGAAHFDRLPGTQEEIAAIKERYQTHFGDAGITVLQAAQATKRAFWVEAAGHRFIHVATHGFFAPDSQQSALAANLQEHEAWGGFSGMKEVHGLHPGLLSGLVLAGANRGRQAARAGDVDADDGILTAEEIGSMNLEGAELVVLSACETGLGQTAGGEGLLGLQRAFQSAGARSVIASLWRVPDAETRSLMERFYENRWKKRMCTLDALREAQLWILHGRPRRGNEPPSARSYVRDIRPLPGADRVSPRDWAAFVLSGDWR